MKKPDDIKKGLDCCGNNTNYCRNDCPYLDGCHLANEFRQVERDALAYIQQLESTVSQVKTRWVSVKEELPETTDVYLVNAVHRYNKKDGYRSVQIRLFLKDHENEWVELPDLYEITHWMPLPELPKEDD